MIFNNKTILIISPQNWGKMWVSKHHYAVELAKLGNRVFYLNPPSSTIKKSVDIRPLTGYENLSIVDHRLFFPYNLKFHAIGLFHYLMKFQIKKILKATGELDIIWSFDIGNLYPFKYFEKKSLKIFHPVDEPLNKAAIDSAKNAQIIFSVTNEILDKYKKFNLPSYFINHGISSGFLKQQENEEVSSKINIGFSGNLLRDDIDRPILLQIVGKHPDYVFNFWGSFDIAHSNIAGSDTEDTRNFIGLLKSAPNVKLHGVVSPDSLSIEYAKMDAFLICYDVQKDQSKGTNYHKVMEFISTGKVVISNNITTYKELPDLVSMVEERLNNNALPQLFSNITGNLISYNNPILIQKRKLYAAENTYDKQIKRIEFIINKLYNNKN